MRRLLLPIAGLWLLAVVTAAGQAAPAQPAAAPATPTSEMVFKNVQVLKGIPVDEFMDTMGMFAAALGYDCVSCHGNAISTDRDAFSVTTPSIQRARQMLLMMNAINRTNFGGEARVSCFTCHRGQIRPEVVPSLALQYGELIDDPNAMAIPPDRRASVDAVFAKYTQALGGAQKVAALTSFVADGTWAGFNTGGSEVPVQVYAQAPGRRSTVVHTPAGDSVAVFDGRNGWVAEEWRPLPLIPLSGSNLAGARMDALVALPAGLRQSFGQWQAGGGIIDERPVQILQGRNDGELPVNLYFDSETGLLVRQVRWNKTAVGTVPTQVDYADYRDVAGVKMPFRTVVTWTNGQNRIALREVRPNAAIDAARFTRPAPFTRR
jgi:outer membrane lipoprotein-sorting protein